MEIIYVVVFRCSKNVSTIYFIMEGNVTSFQKKQSKRNCKRLSYLVYVNFLAVSVFKLFHIIVVA